MRYGIWVFPLAVALILAVPLSPAYAWYCPTLAASAHGLITTVEGMGGDSAAVQAAKKLVDEGMAQHSAGKHNAALETLSKSIKKAVFSVTQKKEGVSKKGYGYYDY